MSTDTKIYPGEHARHCAACDQYGDPSGVAQWDDGCPGLSDSATPEPSGEEALGLARELLAEFDALVGNVDDLPIAKRGKAKARALVAILERREA